MGGEKVGNTTLEGTDGQTGRGGAPRRKWTGKATCKRESMWVFIDLVMLGVVEMC